MVRMTIWDDRLEAHPAKQSLAEVTGLLERITADDAEPVSAESLPYLQRITRTVTWVREALAAVDPELISTAMLDGMTAPIQNMGAELHTFLSDQNEAHLTAADAHADQLLSASSGVRTAAIGVEAVADVQQAVTAFRRSAGQLLRGIEEQARGVERRLTELSGQLTGQAEEISQQRARLDNAIAQYQQQFSEAEALRAQAFQQASTEGRANLDAVANEGRANLAAFASAGQEAVTKFESESQAAVQQVGDNAQQQLNAKLEEATEASNAALKELEDLKEQAVRVVRVIGNTGLTGDYQRIANTEGNAAGRWRLIAIVSFLLAAAGNAVVLGFELHQHVSLTTLIAARVSISVPLLALAAYAIAESHEHRKEERANRSFELQLASIGPYLAEFPNEDQRRILERVFDRFFPGRAAGELPEVLQSPPPNS
jgi:hypothetical protein